MMQRWDAMELNFEGLEIQKSNIPTNRAERVDDKNGVNCLVTMFTPRQNLAYFFNFLPMTGQNSLDKLGKFI